MVFFCLHMREFPMKNCVLCCFPHRSIQPELKSLALGVHTLTTRTLGESCHVLSMYELEIGLVGLCI